MAGNGWQRRIWIVHTGPGPLYISPNYGTTWVSNNLPLQEWVSVAVSADGKTLAAAARGILGANLNYTGPIYTSTNYGVPWRSINLTNQIWSSRSEEHTSELQSLR